nr:reverse transcriptase domain-containing protein [Tanacetum cinerariifolium]
MSSLFADTYNLVAILEKLDAAEGFEQIIDFLSDDITRLQALVDRKNIVISEVVIREILQLDDVEGVVCLSNEEIFVGLAQMGYEKPTSWNEFSTAMASAVICLSKGQKFNFSKYIFDSLVRNVDSSSKFYMYPRFIQLIIQNQVGDLSTHTTRYIFPALTQKVFANMRWVGKGFSGVETPLFEGMLAASQHAEEGITEEQVQADDAVATAVHENVAEDHLENDNVAQKLEIIKLKARVKRLEKANQVKSYKLKGLRKVGTSQRIESSDDMEDVFNQGRVINKDEGIELVKDVDIAETKGRHAAEQAEKQAEIYNLDLDHPSKVLSMQEDDSKVQEVVEVVTTAKLITNVVTAATFQVSAANATIPATKPSIPAAAPTVVAAYTRSRKGVIIRDPEEESSSKTPAETHGLKDKGKGILIESPKPMKKNDQIELDAEYARKLHEKINKDVEEINKDIDWDAVIDYVKQKSMGNQYIKRYYGMKKKPQTEGEARKNMMSYLKNTAGYKMDFFKGMLYDKIRPIFQARFDANMRFLFKTKEEIEEEDQEIIKSINETPTQKAAKRKKLNKEAQKAKDLKKHLEIVNDEDDDVFIESTPLGRKVPVVDYQIVMINNKPRYKIIKVDETHQLYISFKILLKNFDREDLEDLWRIVKERFSTSKPSNFSDDYLLAALKTMFEKPGGQNAVWRNQNTFYGQALVKGWKLLTSCGVHIISFTTTNFILLVERRYPLSKFTMEQLGLMLSKRSKKNTKCVNAADEELTAVKHKLMLLKLKLFKDIAVAADMNESSSNPISTILKHHNRRRSKPRVEPFSIPIVTMVDNCTMEEMVQAPTEGYGDAIVVLDILAENFEIKTGLLSLIQANQFHGFESNNPHDHIRSFNRITSTLKFRDVPNDAIKLMLFPYSLEGAAKIWYKKEPPRSILTWGGSHTFYNGLNEHEQDSLNVVAGGNLLRKTPQDALTIIENKLKVCYSRNKLVALKASTTSSGNSSSTDARIDKLTDTISNLVETFNKKMTTLATVKAVKETCVIYGGAHPYYDCIATDSNISSACATTDLKAMTTRSGVTLAGPSTHPPPSKEVDQEPETIMDQVLTGSTNNVPPLVIQPSPASTSSTPISSPKMHEVTKDMPKPIIPYPWRATKQKLHEKDDNLALKFVEILGTYISSLVSQTLSCTCL